MGDGRVFDDSDCGMGFLEVSGEYGHFEENEKWICYYL